jgi:hypothetical protein
MRSSAVISLIASLLLAPIPAQGEVRAGPWQTAGKVPPGWVVHNTKNYHVQSQCGIEKAKRLGDHMEVMNAVYRRMFKPDKDGAKQYTLKLFKDEQSYHRYGAPEGAAAYYSWTDREMVCYDTGKWSDEAPAHAAPLTGAAAGRDRLERLRARLTAASRMDLLGTAAHEGWHQFFDWYVGSKVELPSWIDEGMGDYFYSAAPKRDKGAKKGAAELGGMNDGRLWVVHEAKRQNMLVPVERFVAMMQSEYYSNPDVCYAQGWVFCQFLLHGAGGKYAKIIPDYVRRIAKDSNWQAVTTQAFKGVDWPKLETEFHAYIDTLKSTEPDPATLIEEAFGELPTEPVPGGEPPAGGPGGNVSSGGGSGESAS